VVGFPFGFTSPFFRNLQTVRVLKARRAKQFESLRDHLGRGPGSISSDNWWSPAETNASQAVLQSVSPHVSQGINDSADCEPALLWQHDLVRRARPLKPGSLAPSPLQSTSPREPSSFESPARWIRSRRRERRRRSWGCGGRAAHIHVARTLRTMIQRSGYR
jgi:hypothetical protein